MFTPVHLLPNPMHPDFDFREELRHRWTIGVGKELYKFILEKIQAGAGEDFLQSDFQSHGEPQLMGFMKDEHDLRGFDLQGESIDFPAGDNFEAVDFSYSHFYNSKFKDAAFSGGYFGFSKLYSFQFEHCLFSFTEFYGVKFENTVFKNCSFVEHNRFVNCEFINCRFDGLFTVENIFFDCNFDVNTNVSEIVFLPFHSFQVHLEKSKLPNLYKGIKDAFLSGGVFDKYRRYLFLQKKAETRSASKSLKRAEGYFVELVTGYGVKVMYPIILGPILVCLFALLYLGSCGIPEALLASASAFTTLGEIPHASPYNFFYVVEAATGIGYFSLLITVLANIWFSEK